MKVVALFLTILLANRAVRADDECHGTFNNLVPWSGDLVKVKEVANGSLYTAGDGDDQIFVLHVYGSPYDMGYAHGVLLKPQIQSLLPAFLKHVDEELEVYLKGLPQVVKDEVAKVGINEALEGTYLLTKPYTAQYFYDEMKGLADGAEMDYNMVIRIHMLPELVKAGCSMLGAWGDSLSSKSGLTQLRALDWDVNGPLQDYPTVVIYHPDNGHAFANVGWSGWLTTISGMSSSGLGVSEKHSDVPLGQESRSGIPFNFLMRDVLQFDESLEQSIRRMQNAHRTCSIWLGVGDGQEERFRLFEYSYSTANVYDDSNVTKIDPSRFMKEHCDQSCIDNYALKDIVYWGVHLGCWNSQLRNSHGNMSAETVINLVGKVQTGDLQAVVYDFESSKMYVSNAKGSNESGPPNAYDRQFVTLDMKALFNQTKPNIV